MLGFLRKRPKLTKESTLDRGFEALPRPEVPQRHYIIGDIHGRMDLLSKLLEMIRSDIDRVPQAETSRLIFLGDYIDRGDDSRDVIEQLMALRSANISGMDPPVFLMGNHELLLFSALQHPSKFSRWLEFGGLQTLSSYGLRVSTKQEPAALEELAHHLVEALGDHLSFLEELEKFYPVGNLFCCHAGVDREVPLHRQSESVLLWGSPDFLASGGPEGIVVVHGHTISPSVDIGHNRIGVDTGAFATGKLSALRVTPGVGFDVLST